MRTEEFLKVVIEVNNMQENHNDFYELAEKYGFCTPWCEKEGCSIIGNATGFDPVECKSESYHPC